MDFIRKLFDLGQEMPQQTAIPVDGPLPMPVSPRVLMITHNPVFRAQGGRKAQQVFGWNAPDRLAEQYIEDIHRCSFGFARYHIVERIEVDGFPIKRDGFAYTPDSFWRAWQTRQFHDPDGVDYLRLVRDFQVIERINSNTIDEVWLFGMPYAGYYESIMAGPGAFFCNAPPLEGTQQATKRFVIMGFNYERGVGEMLEDLGHRAESMLTKVFERQHGDANLFERFTRYDKKYPGRAEVGNVHFAPNSVRDYDWGNPRPVQSRCDNWYRFPDLSGEPRRVTCAEWGNGDIREHHRWWLRHLPHILGESNGISHNWWEYVIDPNRVR